jgi:uncharacterized protein YdaU (DUF1376 family)
VNYFELHIGDYDSATAHLTVVEDGIYGRLLRLYYRTEAPIPTDLKQVCRLVRALSKPERDAVQQVLEEFFVLRDDGWHNGRCDSEIATFIDGEPEREVKAANEKNRLQRHREERATLFKRLTDAGQHAAWNIPMGELRALVQRLEATPETFVPPLPATVTATPATATQTPVPSTHTPEIKERQGAQPGATTSRAPPEEPEPETQATAYGLAAKAMRQQGMSGAHPGDQRLRALVDAGVTVTEFEAAACEAVEKGKGFPWALTALANRRADVAANPIAAVPIPDWRETRDGVSGRAQELGIDAWPEYESAALRRGTPPNWNAYRRQVIEAHERAEGATA